jgi:hypothetical protein
MKYLYFSLSKNTTGHRARMYAYKAEVDSELYKQEIGCRKRK